MLWIVIIAFSFRLTGSGKTTQKSHEGRVLARDLLKKRNLLLILMVSVGSGYLTLQ